MSGRLTLFAGAGALVDHVVSAALAAGYKVQVLALAPRSGLDGVKMVPADLGNPLAILWALKTFRTSHIVMAGGITISDRMRQSIVGFIAARAGEAIPAVGAGPVGDIGFAQLGKVLKSFTGATLVGAHEIAPDLLARDGLIAGPPVPAAADEAVRLALATARAIGAIDLGQAAVVCGARVIAAEDIGGTDELLARVGQLRARGLTGDTDAPMVLAKALKPRQPLFADLPSIGPATLANAAAAGISFIAVEADRSLVIERAEVRAAAERLGVSVIGRVIDDEGT